MIQSCQYRIMTDKRIVIDEHTSLILKFTSRINKNAFSQSDIFPEVGIEGGKETKLFIHRFSD